MKRRDYMLLFVVAFLIIIAFVGIYLKGGISGGAVVSGNVVDDSSANSLSNDDAKGDFDKQRDELRSQLSDRLKSIKSDVDDSTVDFLMDFVYQRGIDVNQINNVGKVDLNSLPSDISVDNVHNANLAIYSVNYSSDQELYVVAYSVNSLDDITQVSKNREFLVYGSSKEMNGEGGFLSSAADVDGSTSTGYIMMRAGSVTAISTALESTSAVAGDSIETVIYKNGEPVRFGNSLSVDSDGFKRDYDVQSEGTVKFLPGDVLSVYVKSSANSADTSWKDAVTLVEITTED